MPTDAVKGCTVPSVLVQRREKLLPVTVRVKLPATPVKLTDQLPSIVTPLLAAALDVKAYLLFKDGSQDFEAADIMLGNIRDDLLQILDEHVMDAIKKNLAAS